MMHGMCNIKVMFVHCLIGKICAIYVWCFWWPVHRPVFPSPVSCGMSIQIFSCYSRIFLICHPQDWIVAGLLSILGYRLVHILMYVL